MLVAIVGATGAVGAEFERCLRERRFPASDYRLLASPRSAGRRLTWCGSEREITALAPGAFDGVRLALFSAGGSISREWAGAAVQAGAVVIDNSSAFRMDSETPLVIPEINPDAALRHRGVIANPNCSTIIMAMVLWPLVRHWRARRVVVSTYQAASGAGARAVEELERQTADVLAGREPIPQVFSQPCAFNVFSHNSAIEDDGFNVEEVKMSAETEKIFGDLAPRVVATCMRVPVRRAHLETLAIEFDEPVSPEAVFEALQAAPGVRVVDDRVANRFPNSLGASNDDDVHVGRIRRDPSVPDGRGILLICAGDQLRKGAALNAVQIAELLQSRGSSGSS